MRSTKKLLIALAALASASLAGCQLPPAPTPSPTGPPVSAQNDFDPCAERLHDIAGALLMYYSSHQQVPQSLSDLGKIAPPPVCPNTGRPYVYDPEGIPMPDGSGSLIVYETRPCSGDTCLAIMAEPPRPRQQLVLRVVHAPPWLIPDIPQTQPAPLQEK